MRFISSAKPTLTPLGHKLLNLSEAKLAGLEYPVTTRDVGSALLKGVLVREAVKSAWRSVEEGLESGLTDWKGAGAMGLDVIGEDEEEEEGEDDFKAEKEERWFEDLLSSLNEDEEAEGETQPHDWVESCVSMAEFDDVEYDEEGMMAFTLPSLSPVSSATSSLELPEEEPQAEVEIIEVEDDDDNISECSCDTSSTCTIHAAVYPTPCTPSLIPLNNTPSSPTSPRSTLSSPCSTTYDYESDDLDDSPDDFLLPPLLHRSYSSNSSSSGEDCECLTPPAVSCEDLEIGIGCEGAEVSVHSDIGIMGLGLRLDEGGECSYG